MSAITVVTLFGNFNHRFRGIGIDKHLVLIPVQALICKVISLSDLQVCFNSTVVFQFPLRATYFCTFMTKPYIVKRFTLQHPTSFIVLLLKLVNYIRFFSFNSEAVIIYRSMLYKCFLCCRKCVMGLRLIMYRH